VRHPLGELIRISSGDISCPVGSRLSRHSGDGLAIGSYVTGLGDAWCAEMVRSSGAFGLGGGPRLRSLGRQACKLLGVRCAEARDRHDA
jgi:hypothetical protein